MDYSKIYRQLFTNNKNKQFMYTPNFNLEEFSSLNLARCNDPKVFNCMNQPKLYFSTALAEEVGEVAGVIKKMARGFNQREFLKLKAKIIKKPKDFKDNPKYFIPVDNPEDLDYGNEIHIEALYHIWAVEMGKKLSEECADVFTYLDLLCSQNGINLWEAVARKFNQVSEQMGCSDEYLIPIK